MIDIAIHPVVGSQIFRQFFPVCPVLSPTFERMFIRSEIAEMPYTQSNAITCVLFIYIL